MSTNTARNLQTMRLDVEQPLQRRAAQLQSLIDTLERSGMDRKALEVRVELMRVQGEIIESEIVIEELMDILEEETLR